MAGFQLPLVIERGDNPPELIVLRPPIGVMIDFEQKFGTSVPATDIADGMFWQHIAWLTHEVDAPDVPFDEWTRTVRLSANEAEVAELQAAAAELDAARDEAAAARSGPTPLPIDRPERPEAIETSGRAAGSAS